MGSSAWPPASTSASLLGLYALQGLSFGLANGSLPVLLARRASFSQIALLSLVSWPYALKGLFAPLVDVFWSRSVGRRKSWVLPCTLLSGLVLGTLAATAEQLVVSGSIGALASALFVAVLCLAAQDVAVDAWAIELLPRKHLAFASVYQTLGMSLGNIVGHPLVLFLTSSDVSLGRILSAVSLAHATMAVLTAFLPDLKDSERPTLEHVLRRMYHLACARRTALIGVMCLLQRISVAMLDGCAEIYYMRLPHAAPEQLAWFAAFLSPVAIIASITAAYALGHDDSPGHLERMILRGALLLLFCGATIPWVLTWHSVTSWRSSAALLGLFVVYAVANKLWWTVQGALFNQLVADSPDQQACNALQVAIVTQVHQTGLPPGFQVRASHLTLLNAISNVGKFWPKPLAHLSVDFLGFGVTSMVFVGFGVALWPAMVAAVHRLLRELRCDARLAISDGAVQECDDPGEEMALVSSSIQSFDLTDCRSTKCMGAGSKHQF